MLTALPSTGHCNLVVYHYGLESDDVLVDFLAFTLEPFLNVSSSALRGLFSFCVVSSGSLAVDLPVFLRWEEGKASEHPGPSGPL